MVAAVRARVSVPAIDEDIRSRMTRLTVRRTDSPATPEAPVRAGGRSVRRDAARYVTWVLPTDAVAAPPAPGQAAPQPLWLPTRSTPSLLADVFPALARVPDSLAEMPGVDEEIARLTRATRRASVPDLRRLLASVPEVLLDEPGPLLSLADVLAEIVDTIPGAGWTSLLLPTAFLPVPVVPRHLRRRRTTAAAPRLDPVVEARIIEHMHLAPIAVSEVIKRKSLPPHVDRDALLSAAHLALVEAAKRFDASRDVTFVTYATRRLHGAIVDELRSSDWASRRVRAQAREFRVARDVLTIELGRLPSTAEVAVHLGVEVSVLHSRYAEVTQSFVETLDVPETVDLVRPDAYTPEAAAVDGEREEFVNIAISALPGAYARVVRGSYFQDETISAIGEELGLTASRISHMRVDAVRLLEAAVTEIYKGGIAEEPPGSRAAKQQRRYLDEVAHRFRGARRHNGSTSHAAPLVTRPVPMGERAFAFSAR